MKKVGFFGGSFNPPTNAHIDLAKKVLKLCDLDELVFVPIGDFYQKSELINFKYRYEMLKIICSGNKNLKVSDIENNKSEVLYAIDIFEIISKKYSDNDIYFVMGTDNLKRIKKWKGYTNLISKYKYIILERENDEFKSIVNENEEIQNNIKNFVLVSDKKYMNISSSIVREKIRVKDDISNIVPKEIIYYIEKNNLYNL